jgi:NAD dependent epimerase/dehydratase
VTLRDRQVVVTGADGFIGSHLTEALVREGARVTALVQYNSFNSWGWLDDIPDLGDVTVKAGDIRDPHYCQGLVAGADTVFHLAALIPIPYSYAAPDSYVETNVGGTLNLCQAARAAGVRRFIHTSTSEVYGTARYVPMDEDHPLTPQSPYSASKIGADAMALSFFYAFKLPVVVARPFNVYGPRQSARAVTPTIISQLVAGAREVELGDLEATRDFTFVEDTCRGLLALASLDGGEGEVFNIGSDQEISVGDLLKTIAELMGVTARPASREERLRPAASEVRRLRCNSQKLAAATGFRPQVSLQEGLRLTIDWFTDPRHAGRYKSHLYNV